MESDEKCDLEKNQFEVPGVYSNMMVVVVGDGNIR